jgi:hypothetical protein
MSAMVLAAGLALPAHAAATAQPRSGDQSRRADELSVTSRLADRREVAAGTRAYSIGFEDGRFYGNGWHITGEMGGVWTPPVKLVDGVWFGLDGQWVGPATSCRPPPASPCAAPTSYPTASAARCSASP